MCNVVVPVHYAIVCCFVHPHLILPNITVFNVQGKNCSFFDWLSGAIVSTYKILCEDINFIEASSCFNAEVVQRPCRLWMIVVYPLAQPTTIGPDLLHCRIESRFLSGAEHDRSAESCWTCSKLLELLWLPVDVTPKNIWKGPLEEGFHLAHTFPSALVHCKVLRCCCSRIYHHISIYTCIYKL